MQRTTNNIGGDCQEKSSVKVSNPAGGKSQFSLGWGADDVEPKASKKQFTNQNHQSFNIFGGDSTADKTSVKVSQKPGGNSSIVLGSEKSQFEDNKKDMSYKPYGYQVEKNTSSQSQPQVHTSVKVHNPPGGKSNITFG